MTASVDQHLIRGGRIRKRGKHVETFSAAMAMSLQSVPAVLLASTSIMPVSSAFAGALPENGSVTAGAGAISSDGTTMTIRQDTHKLAIDWQSFSIGAGNTVRFEQPSSTAAALNRVTGGNPSEILGSLQANGRVFLTNPAGITFGATAEINVGGLVASTLNISNKDFLAGNYVFEGDSAAAIANSGRIQARDGGPVALVAARVVNTGEITANAGSVAIGAGRRVRLDLGGPVQLDVEEAAVDALIEQGGAIRADDGRVVMEARAAGDVAATVINHTGVTQARSMTRGASGGIYLTGGNGGVRLAGGSRIDASGETGGTVEVAAANAMLGGDIDASSSGAGEAGGRISIDVAGQVDLAGDRRASAAAGAGGEIAVSAGSLVETSSSRSFADGATDGGRIAVDAGASLLSSGVYSARGEAGQGGRIDLTAADTRLLSTRIDASGAGDGGLVRIGGAFQGGKDADASAAWYDSFVGRWGALPGLANARQTFINDGVMIDVSGVAGAGGAAVIWSDDLTTFLGAIDATGTPGGAVEISSADTLRRVGLERVNTGPGGTLLLDPKNIVIGEETDLPAGWSYDAVIGLSKDDNLDIGGSPAADTTATGSSVVLDHSGRLLGIRSRSAQTGGILQLISFTDDNFAGAQLVSIVGRGQSGGNNVDTAHNIDWISLSGDGKRLAVATWATVSLIGFDEVSPFMGGTVMGYINTYVEFPENYSRPYSEDVPEYRFDAFVDGNPGWLTGRAQPIRSVSLNADGSLLALGSPLDPGTTGDPNVNRGAVFLLEFGDRNFRDPVLRATIGSGKEIDISLENNEQFGNSVSLSGSGDLLAVGSLGSVLGGLSGRVHLFSFDSDRINGAFQSGERLSVLGSFTAAELTQPVSHFRYTVPAYQSQNMFGWAVSLSNNGSRLAVFARRDAGFGSSLGVETGAVYLFTTGEDFRNPSLVGLIGRGVEAPRAAIAPALEPIKTYEAPWSIRAQAQRDDSSVSNQFQNIALNGNGNRLVIGAPYDRNSASGSVYIFNFAEEDGAFSGGEIGASFMAVSEQLRFSDFRTSTISVSSANISTALSTGTSVVLQANNDITLLGTLNVEPLAGGIGGHLTLQAGRSIFLNESIVTGNGGLTLVVNETNAAGVVNAERDTGAAVLTMAPGVSIDAGIGTVTLALRNRGTDARATSGDMTLRDISAGSIIATHAGSTAGSGIRLLGTLTASDAGNAIQLAAQNRFTNEAGVLTLGDANARWLVWSGNEDPFGANDPANADDRGGLVASFRQYDAALNLAGVDYTDPFAEVSVLGTGNGFLYSFAPELSGTLTGAVSRVYDGTRTASLTAANFDEVTGLVGGDKFTGGDAVGEFDGADVGVERTVSVSGAAMNALIGNGDEQVFGYRGSLSGGIGEIAARPITVTAQAASKELGRPDPVFGFTVGGDGLVGGDRLTGALAREAGERAGSYRIGLGSLGNPNYQISFNPAQLTILRGAEGGSQQAQVAASTVIRTVLSGGLLGAPSFAPPPPPAAPAAGAGGAGGGPAPGVAAAGAGAGASLAGFSAPRVGSGGAPVFASQSGGLRLNAVASGSAGTAASPTESAAADGNGEEQPGGGQAQRGVDAATGAVNLRVLGTGINTAR